MLFCFNLESEVVGVHLSTMFHIYITCVALNKGFVVMLNLVHKCTNKLQISKYEVDFLIVKMCFIKYVLTAQTVVTFLSLKASGKTEGSEGAGVWTCRRNVVCLMQTLHMLVCFLEIYHESWDFLTTSFYLILERVYYKWISELNVADVHDAFDLFMFIIHISSDKIVNMSDGQSDF